MWSLFKGLFEASDRSLLRRINRLEESFRAIPDGELATSLQLLKQRLAKGESLMALLPESFALVREAARRSLNMRHFDVQLIGGIELARGRIVEMATGEGKTLVATLAAVLHAMGGQGVHVVTVNDYLATRDAEWMGRVYRLLGLSVGVIQEEMGQSYEKELVARRAAYACDITYATNHELVFDFLRDNLAATAEEVVQRGFNFCIVDEVDLILIDEAQTPLIISGPSDENPRYFQTVDHALRRLSAQRDYTVDRKSRTASLTDEGLTRLEAALGVGSLAHPDNLHWMHAAHQALQAHAVYENDVDYIVEEGRVHIVDEYTGRVSPDKRFSDGLHQALEAKERVEIQGEDVTLAKTSYQHFFRGYPGLCGMTGTAYSEREEFRKVYFRKTRRIPSHKPMIRKDYRRLVFKTLAAKQRAVVREIAEAHVLGRPILVGSVSVRESEQLSRLLDQTEIPHQVLNAKQDDQEAAIVAQAGRMGAVTVSTNMAGRGTDIILGGNPEKLAEGEGLLGSPAYSQALERYRDVCAQEQKRIMAAGGLYVIGTGEHESVRLDNQLRGRAGRQGDPGSSAFFVSFEDPIYRAFGQMGALKQLQEMCAELPDDDPVENPQVEAILSALREKVVVENEAVRFEVLKYDTVIHEQRETAWSWRRSLLGARDMEDWRESVRDLLHDLMPRVKEAILRRISESDETGDVGLDAVKGNVWSKIVEVISGQTLGSEEKAPLNGDEAEDLLMRRYLQRFGGPSDEALMNWERQTLLQVLDKLWTQYLTDLERIDEGIGLRGYGNLDPLVEFRREAGILFDELMYNVERHAFRLWFAVNPILAAKAIAGEPESRRAARPPGGVKSHRGAKAADRLPAVRPGGRRRRQRRA